jgi:hypothetical protein
MRTLTATLVTMLLLPASAAAKSGIGLSPSPNVNAGQKWQVTLVAIRNDGPTNLPPGAKPAVRITKQGSGESLTFRARRQPDRSWLASVVFPSAGTWTYDVTGMGSLGANQSWDPVTILRPTAAVSDPAPHVSGGGFPFGWAAAAALIVIALGLWFQRRRRSSRRAVLDTSERQP